MRRAVGFTALLAVLVVGVPALAMWGPYPFERVVRESDLIVVGTLHGVHEHTEDWVDFGRGSITVDEVLWGDAEPGEELTLTWQNPSVLACPRVEHHFYEDEEIVWLLTVESDSTVHANHPARHASVDRRAEIEAFLVASPVLVARGLSELALGSHFVKLSYRNASMEPRSFPGLAYEDGTLVCGSAGVALQVHEGVYAGRGAAAGLKGSIVVDSELPPLVVPPGGEVGVVVNLGELFDFSDSYTDVFTVRFSVPGLGEHEWLSTRK